MSSRIKKCPNCQTNLYLSEYTCPECNTTVRGNFQIDDSSPLDRFSDEEKYFILVFLQCSGVIQDVEKIMGISYPTVKAKLSQIQKKLNENGDDDDSDDFDREAFKGDMREFKRQLKQRIRMQVRRHVREGMAHGLKFSFNTESPECCTSEKDECCIPDDEIEIETKSESKRESRTDNINKILNRLESGEITPEQASDEIKKIKR